MSDIVDIIDGALDDWETSEDAMRWSPEPEAVRPTMTAGDAARQLEAIAEMSEALQAALAKMAKTVARAAEEWNRIMERAREEGRR